MRAASVKVFVITNLAGGPHSSHWRATPARSWRYYCNVAACTTVGAGGAHVNAAVDQASARASTARVLFQDAT